MPINPYEILGIDKNATIEEINKAYFILAKKYHPDINKSSEANQRMKEINIAHEILKNSEKRRQFDFTNDDKYEHENQFTSSQTIYDDVFKCQRCGAIDHTLRIVHFPFVISLLIVTLKRGWGGIYCSECRKEEMAKAKIISLFLGWWGFPWGVIYTFESLFLSEGKIPQQPNSEFLKALGHFLFRKGDVYGARESFKLSNDFENDKYIENLLGRLDQMNPIERKKDEQSKPTLTFFRIVLGLVCVIPIFLLSINDFENKKAISPTPTVDVSEYFQAMEYFSGLSSWDTYTNYSNGLSIDYPSNFQKEISDNQISFSTASPEKDSDFIYYQVYFEDLDFSISYTDMTQSIIDNIQTEMFINLGYKVITPLKKEFIDGYPALTGVNSIIIEDINAIEYSSMVFINDRVYTLVVIGPEEIKDLAQTNFQIYKDSFIIN